MPPENKIIKENIILSGPNNNPLTVYGSTIIKLKINYHEFETSVFTVKNLTCHIIIGNNFLHSNKAVINFHNNTLSLNDSITIQTYTNLSTTNINNIKEEIADIFLIDSDFSIAHCISADLKMSKGIASRIKTTFGKWKHNASTQKVKPTNRRCNSNKNRKQNNLSPSNKTKIFS